MQINKENLRRFGAHLTAEEKSSATVEKYLREADHFVRWLEEQELSKELSAAYKAWLAERRSPAGVNGAIAALNSLFTFLGVEECRLKSLKLQRQLFRDEARELTREEYFRLLAAAVRLGKKRLYLVMQAICATGIRVSELQFFTVEAVRMGRAVITNKGKTRLVFLPRSLQKQLLKYARRQGLVSGPVFVTKGGKPLDRSNIWLEMKSLCHTAAVAESKVFPHNLRHLFARTYYNQEKDIVRLADILGHSSVNTTRIYTREPGETHRRQLEQLGLVVAPGQ